MVANRLIEPLSEWAFNDWSERTALPELLDTRITNSSKDRLYRTSDELMKHREGLEKKLRDHEQNLFGLQCGVVLCDCTNTHFEGLCAHSHQVKAWGLDQSVFQKVVSFFIAQVGSPKLLSE